MTNGEPVSGFGTVSGVPGLPDGFAGTFEARLTDVDGVRLHTVSGGDGPRRCCWSAAGRRPGTPGGT